MKKFEELLAEYVAFKSVSTDAQFKGEIAKTVDWLQNLLEESDFKVEVWKGKSNPVVFGFLDIGEKETVLVYGHYDVQPAEIEDGWKGEPFVLRKEGSRLVARGVIDNKGQNLIHIFTVIQLLKEKKLGFNVKFLLEGDEETGTGDLGEMIAKNKNNLAADFVLVSDGEIVGETPTIEVSLRGGFNLTLSYKTANNNLHSGIYGNAAPNAAMELARFLAGLYDENNLVTVPGFYDEVDPITPEQKENNRKLTEVSGDLKASTGIKKFLLESGLDFFSQTGLRPALQVTGLKSGYISEGYANIVPGSAEARINFRLVASQKPETIVELFKDYVAKKTPEYVDYTISVHGRHYPVKVDITSSKVKEVREHLRSSHGTEVLPRHVGGAIPVVADFKKVLGADTLLVPLVNEDCNMHGTEENFKIDLLEKGLDFSRRFFIKK